MSELTLRRARFGELDPATLYGLLRLRVEVFVVEQECPYPELDGRDTEPTTTHLWYERDATPAAYLRVLDESDGALRIGRVCTAADARGAGLAGRLLATAVGLAGDRVCRLGAQSHLTAFYARHGFAPAGPEYLEDGIAHTPMVRRVTTPDLPRP